MTFFHGTTAASGPRPPQFRGFTIILRHTMFGRTALDEWPASRRDLYLATHNIHNRQISMTPMGFEPSIPASGRPQTPAIDRAATRIGYRMSKCNLVYSAQLITRLLAALHAGRRVQMSAAGKRFFSSPRSPDWLWSPSNPSCRRYRGSSPSVKRPVDEFDHSHPSSAHVDNDRSCTSKPAYECAFMTRTWALPSHFDHG